MFSCRLFIDFWGETLTLCIFRWFQVSWGLIPMLHDGYMAVASVAVGYTALGERDLWSEAYLTTEWSKWYYVGVQFISQEGFQNRTATFFLRETIPLTVMTTRPPAVLKMGLKYQNLERNEILLLHPLHILSWCCLPFVFWRWSDSIFLGFPIEWLMFYTL